MTVSLGVSIYHLRLAIRTAETPHPKN